MGRSPSRPHPPMSVKSAATLAQAITDHNAGKPMNRVLLAQAIDRSPASSDYRDLISSSFKYGFTRGNYNSESIELTELGERLSKPRNIDEQSQSLRDAVRSVPIFAQMLSHYANSKLPTIDFVKNTLERKPFAVATEWSKEVAEVFSANCVEVGFVREIGAASWIIPETAGTLEDGVTVGPVTAGAAPLSKVEALVTTENKKPSNGSSGGKPALQLPLVETDVVDRGESTARPSFFIAHGKNTVPLLQLQKILTNFDIPFSVAADEPHGGRPIPVKVRDLMKSCSAGIFIFTADEEFRDKDGNPVWRPRENVIYELGAASLEYERRIVVFKERSVTFPSDFSDIGYIEFEKDNLEGKAMELLKELIALKAVKIIPGG